MELQCGSIESSEDLSPKGNVRIFVKSEEFVEEELKDAMRRGRSYWETLGKRQAAGDCLGNSRTWFYNMANRFGWREKLEVEAEHKGQVNVNVISYATQKALRDKENDV